VIQDEVTEITIKGAREHNLKNIHVQIPRDQLVVITGLSGSGKSSLAFDTIYAEGQRRYVECMSAYARQFLGVMKKPDVDVIEGLSPAISIEQKTTGMSPRSTVGTVTEIYDYLRLLYAKVGTQFCVNCNIPVRQQTMEQIVEAISQHPAGTRVQILSPVIKGRKGHYRELFEQFRRQGFTRVRVDGELQEIVEGMHLPRYKVHTIELVIDRLSIDQSAQKRLTESVEAAIHLGEGGINALIETSPESWKDVYYSTSYSCPSCGTSYETPAPNMFSFNSPFGACSTCEGLGEMLDFDPALVIPDPAVSIAKGAIAPLGKKRDTWLWKQVKAFCQHTEIDVDLPIGELPEDALNAVLYGAEGASVSVNYGDMAVKHRYLGVLPSLRHLHDQTTTPSMRKSIEKYFASTSCRSCGGARLKKEHLHIRIADKNIAFCTTLDILAAELWFSELSSHLNDRQQFLQFLLNAGRILAQPLLERVGTDAGQNLGRLQGRHEL